MALAVAIIGPGALGRSIGAVLEKGGARVGYVGRGGVLEGPTIEVGEGGRPRWAPLPTSKEPVDRLVLFAVKAYDTRAAVTWAAPLLGEDAFVVSLQNGLGNVEAIAAAARGVVMAGATTHAAHRLPSGEVVTTALGESTIALAPGARDFADRLIDSLGVATICGMLRAHGLPTRPAPDARSLLWSKAAVSCGINGLTALERCTNGALLERPAALARAIAAAEEARAIGLASGVDLTDLDAAAALRAVCERTARNRSSMLQDIEAGRPTEVREIHGAVVSEAKKLHLEAPVNAALLHEIESIEAPSLPRARAIPETLTRHG